MSARETLFGHDATGLRFGVVAARFNEQIRAWKAKNQPEKKPS